MTWNYAYNSEIWPSLLTVFLMLGMALYSSFRRNIPGVLPFMTACIFGAVWAAGSVMEYAAADLATKIFWVKVETACQLPAATAVTCFVLEYAWPGRWLTRRNVALLSIVPLLVLGLVATDYLHHFMWLSFTMQGSVVFPDLGPGSLAAIAYSFGLVILSLIIFAWLFVHSPQHRWPVVILVIGHVGVRSMYLLEKGNFIYPELPMDVLGLAFVVIMYGIALFGFRLFDPIPLARRTVIEQLRDGVLVLDPQGRVAGLNPAAERILGASLKQVQNKPIAAIFPCFPELGSLLPGALPKLIDFKSAAEKESHCYELDLSPMNDFRGLPIGHLLMLHDVTEQIRSQAQILEQQRALAMMNEREQLARELHDELSQELAAINVQAQLVEGLLEAGQANEAQDQLQLLAKTAREAQLDVRGEISKLSHSLTQEKGFLGALRQHLESFQVRYGIETELVIPATDQTITFTPVAEVQLVRIVQEALTNIQKHARASHVCVALKREPGCLKLMIEDDGIGFDPESLSSSRQTFGIGIMSNRAEEVNGRVEVESTPGKGTKVTVVVPVNGSSAVNTMQSTG